LPNENARPNEFEIINKYFAPLSGSEPGAFKLTDDAAIIDPPTGQSLVVTTDALVAGVHFFTADPAEDIAAKLLRVSLSDLASMGAEPAHYTLSIAVPEDLNSDWFETFSEGLAENQREFGVTLIGGDTVSTSGPLTLSLTAMGYIEKGMGLRRSKAKVGDSIWVSGTIGDGALGLLAVENKLADLSSDDCEYLRQRYRLPIPRTKLGQNLIGNAHAVIDISDGLVADLGHICETSGVGADVQIADIPLSKAANGALAENSALLDLILGGGDDYELLFTTEHSFAAAAEKIAAESGVTLTKIGEITNTGAIRLFDQNGQEHTPRQKGFTHF
tara:strand:- start:22517 stop:23509 length:993 start_codon:yes stop_codon:yes gene_type:complete